MKKLFAFMLTLALCACAIFSMTACGGVEGTYKFESMSYSESGVSVTINAGEEFMGFTFTEDYMTIELKSDGTAVMVAMGETTEVTWKQDGDKIKFYDEDGEQGGEVTIDGDKLILEESGAKIVLSK